MGHYHRYRKRGFDFGNFEITKREIFASVSIITVMLLIGVLISGKISEYQMDKNEIYNKAMKIQNSDIFAYGMRTNIGNAFVYGDLKAVDTVTYPEITGEYMYVEKVKERYTRHTRQVAHTRMINGKSHTYYTTEVYWTWDRVGSERQICKEVSFLECVFASGKIEFPEAEYIDTIKRSSYIRYKYYGVGVQHSGTIFTELKDNTISNNTPFYRNKTIDETIESLESGGGTIIFWVLWIIFICVCIYGFYYLDNRWLD